MEQVVSSYLNYLSIPVSESYCEQRIVSHPNYPSLLSIADVLQRLGIEYQVGQMEKATLEDLPFPCLLHFEGRGLVFLKREDDLDDQNIILEDWDGIILKAEPTDTITDKEHNEQYRQEKIQRGLGITLIGVLSVLFLLAVTQVSNLLMLLLFLTSIAGGIVGYLLIAKDLGITYKPVETFCNAGKRTNCDRILNAEDATLFGVFTFSDAAASYFGFQLITVVWAIFGATSPLLWTLSAASVLSFPVVGYSLYYQWAKAQTWCGLCVIVDGVLVLQAGLFAMMYANQMVGLTSGQLLPVVGSLLLFPAISSVILLLKDRLQKASESVRAETIAKQVKHDPEVFTQMLLQQEKADVTPFSHEMTVGNPDAPVNILMAANLHCNPCRQAFDTVRQILASYSNLVQFSIRFTPGMRKTIGELSASTYLIRYWQEHIFGQEDETGCTEKLLADWYESMDPEVFLKSHMADDIMENNGTQLAEQHYRWVEEQEIVRTPTFLINGYEMPERYQAKDLINMIPGMAALWKNKTLSNQKSVKQFA